MPINNPVKAIKTLYPSINDKQYRFRDDGFGVYLEWLDPSLGDPPTQSELEAAELAYLEPSYLTGGSREPGLADIQANLLAAYDYFRYRVGKKIKSVAKDAGFSEVSRNEKGEFVETGIIEKAAKYSQVTASPFRARASALIKWESDVWAYLQSRWTAIDPRGDFTGFDGVTPPTWPMLENDIDTNFPAPR